MERSREFTLVPWRPVIEKQLGRQVSALVRGDGVSWEFGRKRGLGIGMQIERYPCTTDWTALDCHWCLPTSMPGRVGLLSSQPRGARCPSAGQA